MAKPGKKDLKSEALICNPEEVIDAEKKYLHLDKQKSVSGLAISGGGIRSASFGLGVMQALVAYNQLEKIDYMSTVSGGGYLGSALTWALHQDKNAGTSPENFPLGKRIKDEDESGENDSLLQKENKLLDYIRQHSNYLTPTPSLDIVSFGAVVWRSMAISLFVYFSFLTVAMTSALWLIYKIANTLLGVGDTNYSIDLEGQNVSVTRGVMIFVGIFIFIIIFFKGFIYSLGTFFRDERVSKLRYKIFIKGQKSIGFLLKLSLTCLVFGSLPYIDKWFSDISTFFVASGSTLFGTLVGLWQYVKAQKNEKSSGMKSDLLIYGGAFALFYGILLLSYLSTFIFLNGKTLQMDHPILFAILFVLSLIFGLVVNLNLIGPHHIWRNRLMEAFMPNKTAVEFNRWEPATEADGAVMEDMCCHNNSRPYHIVNTNIILTNSPKVDFSSRGGDNYMMSPLFYGSAATGWRSTETAHKEHNRGISLATAMATSAAALNPNAGVSGEGVTRNIVVSILLSFLNLRLGYWTSNPALNNPIVTPNFFIPGLTSEIFRTGLTENNRFIQLSDGGHFENLGLYELIRRKLDLIIVSDGGADPAFNFDDLANAIEKVRVDFGTKISFLKGYKLDDILPGTGGQDYFQKKYAIAKKGFAIADINYIDGTKGKLIYVKLAMIEGLPTDVYSYKGMNPSFPHQSTADQFFNEKQFEAYRELGYYVAKDMLTSEETKKILHVNS